MIKSYPREKISPYTLQEIHIALSETYYWPISSLSLHNDNRCINLLSEVLHLVKSDLIIFEKLSMKSIVKINLLL